jgi:hypothetical protein
LCAIVGGFFRLAILGLLPAVPAMPQSTAGLISGRITNARTGAAIADARVTCQNSSTNTSLATRTNTDGYYTLPLLPPGQYELEVAADTFQPKAQFEVPLGVASSMDLDFSLRPLQDLWQPSLPRAILAPRQRSLVNFYGPDVDPNYWTTYSPNPGRTGKLESSLSDAVEPIDIQQLPLEGNNIYAILLAEPGVAASNSTSRSLGIAANGMRPSSSSFLLDGADANYFLITGPLVAVSPEAVQEYRLSTNNFSAEYGGTAGYIANAVTRSGGGVWHGKASVDLQNEILNANDFQDNANSLARQPSKELRTGYFAGGPAVPNRLFIGSSVEYFKTRDREGSVTLALPNQAFLNYFGCPSAQLLSCQLLRNYPVPPATPTDPFVTPMTFEPPISLNRWLAVERLDYSSASGFVHGAFRIAAEYLSRPDFIWSPYPDYVSGMTQPTASFTSNWTFQPKGGSSVNHLTVSWSYENLNWNRARPDVPTLVVSGGNSGLLPILPGSLAAYGLNDRNRTSEFHDDQMFVRGRHIVKVGGGFLFRQLDDFLGYGLDGEYSFSNILSFGLDQPSQFTASLSRLAPNFVQPDLSRAYRESQIFGFLQDTYRITSRFVLNAGVRYDNFGSPVNTGQARDPVVELGRGTSIDERLAGARLVPSSSASLFSHANLSLEPRLGFAYDLFPRAGVVIRGGFGLFYDRIFDNLWLNARNNSVVFPAGFPVQNSNYLSGVAAVLPSYAGQPFSSQFPYLTAFQSPFPNGYAEDFFTSIQQQTAANWLFEVNGAGSLGRKLVTSDVLNRQSVDNPSLPPINWIGSEGRSDYYSLSTVARWHGKQAFLQAAYTWSHAIDNQSDPLAGNFFNLLFVNVAPPTIAVPQAGFSSPGDSRGDRGNADFDQRQTFVFYGSWSSLVSLRSFAGTLLNNWTISTVSALRSGFPYTVYTEATDPQTINARARVISPTPLLPVPIAVPGGERLFDASAFCPSDACSSPESGRNAFAGPGLINLDLSVARTFRVVALSEGSRITLRADFFNALNHANLNPPGSIPGTSSYGIALFGTPPASSGFPVLVPLTETARRIQLSFRMTF